MNSLLIRRLSLIGLQARASSGCWCHSEGLFRLVKHQPKGQIMFLSDSRVKGIHYCVTRCFHLSGRAMAKNKERETEVMKGDKLLRVKLPSARLDAVLKAGLSLSRNKIEKALYEDRIRVNGVRPKKKSQSVEDGDEIDIVKGINSLNPDFLDVNRVEVMEIGEGEEDDESDASDSDSDNEKSSKIPALLKRSKMLTVQNYTNAWKGNTSDS